jgi:N-acyl-D-aspartate/D-glutamate deacylase
VWKELLELSRQCFEAGVRTYGVTSTLTKLGQFTLRNAQLFDTMPAWRPYFVGMDADTRLAQLARPEVRAALEQDAVTDRSPNSFSKRWDAMIVKRVATEANRGLEGKSIAELAERSGRRIIDTFLDLALAENGDTVFETVIRHGDRDAIATLLTDPHVLVGLSDAGGHVKLSCGAGYTTELLGKWVREERVMSLETAVEKLTSVPASIFGFQDRGALKPGMRADVVVFDPATVAPCTPRTLHDYPGGEARLTQEAVGVEYTAVNGTIILEKSRFTGEFPGEVIRGS